MLNPELYGVLGGIFTATRLVPQTYKSLKTKHVRDLSLGFCTILFFQDTLLMTYGATKPDWLIFWMNVPALICTLIMLWCKWIYRNNN
jgi:uncharacterized protein with PQ loop repeat